MFSLFITLNRSNAGNNRFIHVLNNILLHAAGDRRFLPNRRWKQIIPYRHKNQINMKTWIKIVIGLAVLGIIGGWLGYTYIYNKPHRDYEAADPDYTLEAAEVYNRYTGEREEAEKKFNGKVLEISGTLHGVETPDSLTIAVFAFEEGMFGNQGIRCTLLEGYKDDIRSYTGKQITLKGYCTGYNGTDVILEKCSIIN